ncbi:MAG: hypothetical protein ACYDHZ_05080 [Dehalococcoidia bacterium]|jgi:hypothetical protein
MRKVYLFLLPAILIIAALMFNCAPPPVYVNDFEVTPNPVTQGENATLRWATSYAAAVTIDNGVGDVPAYGTLSVAPDVTTTYSLTAKNGGTSVLKTLILTVNPRPAAVAAPEQIPTISALDTEKLLSYVGKDVQVEGVITYISSWLPSRYLEEDTLFPWTFVFFMSNPWEGASSDLGSGYYPCQECWRDFTAYFRAIIRPEYIGNFVDPSRGAPLLYAGQHVLIHGAMTGYLAAPAIYLTSAGQVTTASK